MLLQPRFPLVAKLLVRFKTSSSSSRWLARARNDKFTKEAQNLELRSRAAFKLMELDDKFKLFKKGQSVLDLGFAPGAWSQVAFERTKPKNKIVGVDLLPCQPPKGVTSIQANILSKKTQELIRHYFSKPFNINNQNDSSEEIQEDQELLEVEQFPVDVVISDMMANTTGVAIKDHYMSMDLCDAALITAIDLLKPGGSFVCKLYTGAEDHLLEKRLQRVFSKVHRFKPQACRAESKETYMVGLRKKTGVDKFQVFSE